MSRRFKTEGNSTENQRAVWLLARHHSGKPASDEGIQPDSWVLLLGECTLEDIKAIALHRNSLELEEIDLGDDIQDGYDLRLGTLWELILVGCNYNYRRREKVKFSDLQMEWKSFSGQQVGTTEMSDNDMDGLGMTLSHVSNVKPT